MLGTKCQIFFFLLAKVPKASIWHHSKGPGRHGSVQAEQHSGPAIGQHLCNAEQQLQHSQHVLAWPDLSKPGCVHFTASFPNPISVHIVPVEVVETDLVVEDIDDDWSDEVAHEPTAWDGLAELVAQGRPLPPIEEELQEEETR